LLIDGGSKTARVADAVPPVPPSVEVTALVVLFCTPVAVLVTFTPKVQDELPVKIAPDRLIVFDPATAVMPPPPQPPASPFGVEMTSPAGNVSVIPIPLSVEVEFGLVMVKLKPVVPLRAIEVAPNVLVIAGGATTVKLAEAVPPEPPSVELTAPVVLVCRPAAVAVTLTLKVQDAPAAIVPAARLTLADPGAAVMVPVPHEPVRPFGVATRRPAGSVSVNATPLSD